MAVDGFSLLPELHVSSWFACENLFNCGCLPSDKAVNRRTVEHSNMGSSCVVVLVICCL